MGGEDILLHTLVSTILFPVTYKCIHKVSRLHLKVKNVCFCRLLAYPSAFGFVSCSSPFCPFYSPELFTQNKTSDGRGCSCTAQLHVPHPASFLFFFPSILHLAVDLPQSHAAISFSSLSKILLATHFCY